MTTIAKSQRTACNCEPFFVFLPKKLKKLSENLHISKKSSTFAPAFQKLEFGAPEKFLIFGESESTAIILMSDTNRDSY